MTDPTAPRPDARPVWLRLLVWSGFALAAALGPPILVVGLAGLEESGGKVALCFGLVLILVAAAGVALEVALRRFRLHPPSAQLATVEGESALFLPRDPAPIRVASLLLAGFAGVLALGAVLAGVERSWGVAAASALVAAYLIQVAGLRRTSALAGGLWLTPTRLIHEHLGARWVAGWDVVRGVVAREQMPVMVAEDRLPAVERTGPRGRGWRPHRGAGVFVVDTRHLAHDHVLVGYLITKALTDPASRGVLGTPGSLPPGSANDHS